MGVELLYADRRSTDGQTDMTKLIVTSRNFANEPKIVYFIPYFLLGVMCDANAALAGTQITSVAAAVLWYVLEYLVG